MYGLTSSNCALQYKATGDRESTEQLTRSSTLHAGSPLPISLSKAPAKVSRRMWSSPGLEGQGTEMMQDFFHVILGQPGSRQNKIDVANDCHHKWVTSLALLPGKEKIHIIFVSSSPVVPRQKRGKRYCPPCQLAVPQKETQPSASSSLIATALFIQTAIAKSFLSCFS